MDWRWAGLSLSSHLVPQEKNLTPLLLRGDEGERKRQHKKEAEAKDNLHNVMLTLRRLQAPQVHIFGRKPNWCLLVPTGDWFSQFGCGAASQWGSNVQVEQIGFCTTWSCEMHRYLRLRFNLNQWGKCSTKGVTKKNRIRVYPPGP